MARRALSTLASLICLTLPLFPDEEPRLIVTVANQFGFPVTTLKAEDFIIKQDGALREVKSAQYKKYPVVDAVLMVETSELGQQIRGEVQHIAELIANVLAEKEQLAIVGYDSSADLVQDFTSSRDLLRRAFGRLKYGNRPQLMDSIYAVVDGAFERSGGRRVAVVIGSGVSWRDRVERREVVRMATRNEVSVFAISFGGDGDLEKITEQTGGLFYRGKELKQIKQLVENLTSAWRGAYELQLSSGVDTNRAKVELRSGEKMRVGFRVAH